MAMSRARRVVVPRAIQDGGGFTKVDYASAFAMSTRDAEALTAEQWARATFDAAPAPLRWLMVVAWTRLLGLRLGPRSSPRHVLGWPVAESGPDDGPESIILAARSSLITAHNVVTVRDADVVWSTFVRFDHRLARRVWSLAAPAHHRMVPFLLGRAVERRRTSRAPGA